MCKSRLISLPIVMLLLLTVPPQPLAHLLIPSSVKVQACPPPQPAMPAVDDTSSPTIKTGVPTVVLTRRVTMIQMITSWTTGEAATTRPRHKPGMAGRGCARAYLVAFAIELPPQNDCEAWLWMNYFVRR